MDVIGLVFLMLDMYSKEILALKMSPEILAHNESSFEMISENATGVATRGQQTQLRYSSDKENISLDGNVYLAEQSNRTLTESQLESITVDVSIDSFTINIGVSKPGHLVRSEPILTATSVSNSSTNQLNFINKILSETNYHSSMKPNQEANYTPGDQVKLFQKYGNYVKPIVSNKYKPALTVQDFRRELELMSKIVTGNQNGSGESVSLSENREEIAGVAQVLNTNVVYKIPQHSGLERVTRRSKATTEIVKGTKEEEITGVAKSGINKIPDNLVLNDLETLVSEEESIEETLDLEFLLKNRSTEENNAPYKDAQGNFIPCNMMLSVPINDANLINGSLHSPEYNVTFSPGFFWKNVNNNYFGCICSLLPCIRKCCPKDKMFPARGDVCIPRTTGARPFAPEYFDDNTYEPVEVDEEPVVLYGMPCKFSYVLDSGFHDEENYLLPNGSVLLPYYSTTIEADTYCMETIEGRQDIGVLKCISDLEYDYDYDDYERIPFWTMHSIGYLISIPFLFMTFFVYGIISELRNLHGKSFMCHVSSVAVGYICLLTVHTQELNSNGCVTFAVLSYFMAIASVSWLNVLCFDIFWTFSGIRPLKALAKERENKKFIMYSCYAWGVPFLLVIICIFMEYEYIPGIYKNLTPALGYAGCWFACIISDRAYFYGLVGAMLTCNLLFFIITIIRIFQLKQESAILKGCDSRKIVERNNTERFEVYWKLFIMMGINWLVDVISKLAAPEVELYIGDCVNTIQNALIFYLFACNKNVRTLLAKRFCMESEPRNTGNQT